MELRYVWREQTRDGRLLDPDELVEEALYSLESQGFRFRHRHFNSDIGHETEEDAVEAYKKAVDLIPSWALPSGDLVLLKVYT
jgi:hypothetical protein